MTDATTKPKDFKLNNAYYLQVPAICDRQGKKREMFHMEREPRSLPGCW